VRLKRLTGPDVGGWQLDEGEGGDGDGTRGDDDERDGGLDGDSDRGDRTLTVFLRRSVDDETRIFAEVFLTDGSSGNETSFDVPSLAPREITRESGEIVVLADDLREVRIDEAQGLSRTGTSAGMLPGELNPQSLPVRGVFRFSSRPWRLSVGASVRAQEMRVTAEHGMFVGRRKILLGSRLQFELSGAPRRRLRVLLPHDFLLLDLHSTDVKKWFVEADELVLDLGEPRVGRVVVTFEGQIARLEDDAEAVLETPLPTDVQRQESRLAIWIEDELSATLAEFAGWRPVAPEELSTELRSLHSQPVQFAFRSSEVEPELIILQMDAAQPRLVCDAITLIAVSDTSVDYGLTLRWTIERAATDRLTFTTPDWLDERLRFTSEGIRRTSSDFLDDGRVRWTVSLDNAVRGQFLVSAVATLPLPANGIVTAPLIRFGEVAGESDEFVEVPVQETYAVLVNLSGMQITAVAEEAHEEVRAGDLPFKLRDDLVAQAMEAVRMRGGAGVSWQMQPVIEQQAATATVTSADLTTILAADGSWRTQADYRVRNRGHQFLAVRLPAGARLLSVLVKDQPTRAQQTELTGEAVALVPLPQTSAADLSFEITLVLQGVLPRPLSRVLALNGDRVSIPVPTVVAPRESAEYGVPVVHTQWSVSIPEEFRAAPVMEEGLTNVSRLSEGAGGVMPYLQQLQELADLNRLVQDSSVSYSQRKRAADNLRQLGAMLQKPSDQYGLQEMFGKSPATIPEELRELAQQQEQLLSESLRNADALEGVLSKQEADGMLLPDPQRNGRWYIEGNTAAILRDNVGAGTILPAPKGGAEFRFDLPQAAGAKAGERGGPIAESPLQQSRSLLRDRLARQELLFEQAPQQVPQDAQAQTFGQELPPQRGGRSGLAGAFGGAVEGPVWDEFQHDSRSLTELLSAAAAVAGTTGGLSLPVDIPLEGHTLEFTKLGGDPQLTLAVRPRESIMLGLRWLWTVVWIGVGVTVLWLLFARGRGVNWRPPLGVACLVLGLVALAFLPWPAAWVGPLLLLTGGVIWLTTRSGRSAATSAGVAG
jgi:hypothetical protein